MMACVDLKLADTYILSQKNTFLKRIHILDFLKKSAVILASHAGVFRGARGEGWKTSPPKNACVGGYHNLELLSFQKLNGL